MIPMKSLRNRKESTKIPKINMIVLFKEDRQWRLEPWAAGEIFLQRDTPVLELEALGLDDVVQDLKQKVSETANACTL